MSYVDGFLLAVKKDKLDNYKEMATQGHDVWMEHGALVYKECVLDDDPRDGMHVVHFPELIAAADEVVVFSFIVYRDRAHRDEVNAKVMADPRMSPEAWKDKAMPFEMNKMYFGGFKPIVEG